MKLKMMKWVNHWYWILTDLKEKFRKISFKRSHKGRWSVDLPSMRWRQRPVILYEAITGLISTIALFFTNVLFPSGGAYAFYAGLTTALTYVAAGAAMWGASSLLSSLGQKKPESNFARGGLLFSTVVIKDESYHRNPLT